MTYHSALADACGHSLPHVLQRINDLVMLDQVSRQERQRIQSIMDGGIRGIHAVMAWDMGRQTPNYDKLRQLYGVDLPTVNLMASGSDRLAHDLGDIPLLKPQSAAQTDMRERFVNRAKIVEDWDELNELELQFPQIGRWLPGYGQTAQFISWHQLPDGTPYPKIELRDSFDVYCGWQGGDVEPPDLVVKRIVPLYALERIYPDIAWSAAADHLQKVRGTRTLDYRTGGTDLGVRSKVGGLSTFDGPATGVEVVEYWNHAGTSYVIPELSLPLTFCENPIDGEPSYVVDRKYSFNQNVSQYHHIIGIQAMMAKLNIISLIASEDSVFRETNIIGDWEGQQYKRGRMAVNRFAPGTVIDKPTGDMPQALWAMIDRLERQLRIGAAYDVSNDGISPNSFATGQGIRELQGAAQKMVAEYQKVIRRGALRLDRRRLAWAEAMWPKRRTKIYYGDGTLKHYTPDKDIKGEHITRRVYGIPGMWDSNANGIVGLQFLGAGVVDVEALQDSVPGIGTEGQAMLRRIDGDGAKRALLTRLTSMPPGQFTPGPVEAMLIEIMEKPENMVETLKKWASPQEPEMSPEEEAFAGGGLGVPGSPDGPPIPGDPNELMAMMEGGMPMDESSQTAMSRSLSDGTSDAGVQTVTRL